MFVRFLPLLLLVTYVFCQCPDEWHALGQRKCIKLLRSSDGMATTDTFDRDTAALKCANENATLMNIESSVEQQQVAVILSREYHDEMLIDSWLIGRRYGRSADFRTDRNGPKLNFTHIDAHCETSSANCQSFFVLTVS